MNQVNRFLAHLEVILEVLLFRFDRTPRWLRRVYVLTWPVAVVIRIVLLVVLGLVWAVIFLALKMAEAAHGLRSRP